jgi:hypothetical protein
MKDLQGSIKTTSTVKGYQTSLQVQNKKVTKGGRLGGRRKENQEIWVVDRVDK